MNRIINFQFFISKNSYSKKTESRYFVVITIKILLFLSLYTINLFCCKTTFWLNMHSLFFSNVVSKFFLRLHYNIIFQKDWSVSAYTFKVFKQYNLLLFVWNRINLLGILSWSEWFVCRWLLLLIFDLHYYECHLQIV